MDFASLQIFKAVADAGGVTRAAARLHRVPSNVTTRLRQLEEKLGTALFHRSKRRLTLSSEGRTLLAYADRLLNLSAEAQAAVRDGAPRGRFALGSLESTAATRLPALLARFHAAHPDLRVELATGTTGALIERVLAGELAAAFVAEPFTADGLEIQHVFTEELVLIAPRSVRSLGHGAILAFAAGCSYRRRLESWLQRQGVAPERVMEYGSYHAIVACVAAGGGIAIVPRSVLAALRPRGALQVRQLPREVAQARTFLVWKQASSALAALRAVVSPGAPKPSRAAARSRRPARGNGARARTAAAGRS